MFDKNKKIKDFGTFEKEPTFAFLWNKCVYELLYNPSKYTEQFCNLLSNYGVNKESTILDVCAGSGFPTMDMYRLGYKNITCVDGYDEQIDFFNKRAEQQGLGIRSSKCSFNEVSEKFKDQKFKALVCRGGIWYSAGGYHENILPERESSLRGIKETLVKFYDLLETGGVLYVDKFRDSEVDHEDVVGTFSVGTDSKEMVFNTHRDRELSIRYAQMKIRDIKTKKDSWIPNVTYDLKESELGQLLEGVGFTVVRSDLSEEKFFAVWIAIKK